MMQSKLFLNEENGTNDAKWSVTDLEDHTNTNISLLRGVAGRVQKKGTERKHYGIHDIIDQNCNVGHVCGYAIVASKIHPDS